IIKVIEDISPKKIAAVVSDNGSNVRVARRTLCEKYPYILDISTVWKIGTIHQYFTKSHATCQFLKDAIKVLKIKSGDLKDHTKTRWSTMWDCVSSIV
ncbi:2332_t:CDS:2, partial [Racocetra fulgida]